MSKKILLVSVGLLLLAIAAFAVLITPGNPFTRLFRGKITTTDSRVVLGPYPLEEDFQTLRKHEVTTIVSLLDARLPYEKVLLEREQEMAQKFQMKVLNFPMSSVFGHQFDDDRDQRIQAAAQAIARENGKVYLHCYLGIHRAKLVEEALNRAGTSTDRYLVRQGERSDQARTLDQAQADFDAGRYRETIDRLKQIPQPDTRARLLLAWATFRAGDIPAAREAFENVRRIESQNLSARIGLGYCALRDNKLPEAEEHFAAALQADAQHTEARMGMGIVRFRQNKSAEAADHLEAVLRADPKNEEARDLLNKVSGSRTRAAK